MASGAANSMFNRTFSGMANSVPNRAANDFLKTGRMILFISIRASEHAPVPAHAAAIGHHAAPLVPQQPALAAPVGGAEQL